MQEPGLLHTVTVHPCPCIWQCKTLVAYTGPLASLSLPVVSNRTNAPSHICLSGLITLVRCQKCNFQTRNTNPFECPSLSEKRRVLDPQLCKFDHQYQFTAWRAWQTESLIKCLLTLRIKSVIVEASQKFPGPTRAWLCRVSLPAIPYP